MPEIPDFTGNACAALAGPDRDRLWDAAKRLADAGNPAIQLATLVGSGVERAGNQIASLGARLFGRGWEDRVKRATDRALWRAYDLSTLGLDKQAPPKSKDWLNKAITGTSGAVSGLFGLPGALVDIPISTLVMMRAIAEIARAQGEDLTQDEARRACLQVFAFGGPDSADDDAEIGYWSTRLALANLGLEPLIARAATVLAGLLSEKALAMAAPLAGAASGLYLNVVFTSFYQDMARVHFTLRALERQYGPDSGIRACFDSLHRQARTRRAIPRRNEKQAETG